MRLIFLLLLVKYCVYYKNNNNLNKQHFISFISYVHVSCELLGLYQVR